MWNALLMVLLFSTAVFLILLVLIQRGRGGGLAGAFGGLGGQSAFGTKAGDLFTRITIGVATFWIILCAASVKLLNDQDRGRLDSSLGQSAATAPAPAGGTQKAPDATPGAAGGGKAAPAEPASGAAAPESTAPASAPGAAPAQGGETSPPAK